MITINLLPWRDERRVRQYRQKWRRYGGAIVLVLAGFLVYVHWHHPVTMQAVAASSPLVDFTSPLQQIRFAGFMQQQNRTWGLLVLPTGKTQAVQVGARIASAEVIEINEEHLVFRLPDQKLYSLFLSDR